MDMHTVRTSIRHIIYTFAMYCTVYATFIRNEKEQPASQSSSQLQMLKHQKKPHTVEL